MTLLLLYLLATAGRVSAHEGDHQAEKQKTHATVSYFSSENSSEKYEILVKYGELTPGREAHFTLFLSDVNTNVPVKDARLKISSPDDASQVFEVSAKDPGIYEVHTEFTQKKAYKLNISVDAQGGADLIQVTGVETGRQLPHAGEEEVDGTPFKSVHFILIGLALLAGLGMGLFFKRKTAYGKSGISMFLLALFVLSPAGNYRLLAHGGEDHQNEKQRTGEASAQFLVAKETQFLFDIRTSRINTGNFSPSVSLFGTVLPSPAGRAVVQTPQTGIIRSLNVIVGQNVNKGQLLASVEQNVDAGTQVSWLTQKNELEAELSAAKKEYDRLKSIADIVAKKDIDEAERRYQTARQNLNAFESLGSGKNNSRLIMLYAPIDGKIDNFTFSVGSTVNAGQEILSVTNLKTVFVEAQVFDKDIEHVRTGKEYLVECTDNHHTEKVRLVTMSPSINTSNQSQKVLFEMDNTDGDFKIGEFVNIRVFGEADSQHITLPNSAITEINGKSAVFVKDAAEHYSMVYVSAGENNGQYTTILKGVEEYERVVVNGTYQLKMMYLNQ